MVYEEENGVKNSKVLRENLDLIEEQRDYTAMRIAAYHRRITSYYNSQVRNRPMEEGNLILQNFAITSALWGDEKLRANCEGPYL